MKRQPIDTVKPADSRIDRTCSVLDTQNAFSKPADSRKIPVVAPLSLQSLKHPPLRLGPPVFLPFPPR